MGVCQYARYMKLITASRYASGYALVCIGYASGTTQRERRRAWRLRWPGNVPRRANEAHAAVRAAWTMRVKVGGTTLVSGERYCERACCCDV